MKEQVPLLNEFAYVVGSQRCVEMGADGRLPFSLVVC